MSKYGWPFLLFIIVPLAATLGSAFVLTVTEIADDPPDFLRHAADPLATAVLLGILYLFVRKSGRDTLRLVWGCTLTVSAVSALLNLGALLMDYEDSLESLARQVALVGILTLLPQFWFARLASRFSLAHAYFLFFVVGGLNSLSLAPSSPMYAALLSLAIGILAVWLLANFDLRGPSFRKASALVVVALHGLSVLWLPLQALANGLSGTFVAALLLPVALVTFALPLVLVYLLRVRQPEGGAPRVSTSEQR